MSGQTSRRSLRGSSSRDVLTLHANFQTQSVIFQVPITARQDHLLVLCSPPGVTNESDVPLEFGLTLGKSWELVCRSHGDEAAASSSSSRPGHEQNSRCVQEQISSHSRTGWRSWLSLSVPYCFGPLMLHLTARSAPVCSPDIVPVGELGLTTTLNPSVLIFCQTSAPCRAWREPRRV